MLELKIYTRQRDLKLLVIFRKIKVFRKNLHSSLIMLLQDKHVHLPFVSFFLSHKLSEV